MINPGDQVKVVNVREEDDWSEDWLPEDMEGCIGQVVSVHGQCLEPSYVVRITYTKEVTDDVYFFAEEVEKVAKIGEDEDE